MKEKTILPKKESKAQNVVSLIQEHITDVAAPDDFIQTLDTLFDHWLIYHPGQYEIEQKDQIVNQYRHLQALLREIDTID